MTQVSPRETRPGRRIAIGSLLLIAAGAGAVACVVETEPGPKKVLLRDIQPRASAPSPAVVALPDAATPITAPSDPAVEASGPPVSLREPPPVPDSFRTCEADADCAAVLRNGCCHDGRSEAVNKRSVDTYKASFTCPVEKPRCPMHLVLDRRLPSCDQATHACTLVSSPVP